ncbi:MAG: hypothetical protein QG578_1218 [Thermodesulfobacteriota bacterium]|nr:hypothetical protein [Thermodesulfobacteriota bacterium]
MELNDKISELEEANAKLRRAFEGAIQTLTISSEIRDPYTAGHQRRVTDLAVAIAKAMNQPENVVAAI